jgi:hypothetical protein
MARLARRPRRHSAGGDRVEPAPFALRLPAAYRRRRSSGDPPAPVAFARGAGHLSKLQCSVKWIALATNSTAPMTATIWSLNATPWPITAGSRAQARKATPIGNTPIRARLFVHYHPMAMPEIANAATRAHSRAALDPG